MLFLYSRDFIVPTLMILFFPLIAPAKVMHKSIRSIDDETTRLKSYLPRKIFEFVYILSRQKLRDFGIVFSIFLLIGQGVYLSVFTPLILFSSKIKDIDKMTGFIVSLVSIVLTWGLTSRIIHTKFDRIHIKVVGINPEITFLKDCRFCEGNQFNERALNKVTKFGMNNSPSDLTKKNQRKFLRGILRLYMFYDLALKYSENKKKFSLGSDVVFQYQTSTLTLDEIRKKTNAILATCQVEVKILRVREDTIIEKHLTKELWENATDLS